MHYIFYIPAPTMHQNKGRRMYVVRPLMLKLTLTQSCLHDGVYFLQITYNALPHTGINTYIPQGSSRHYWSGVEQLVAAEIYVVMIKLQPSFSTLQETFLLVHA
jgi:hypothetical protein